jgi:hypothetical protein
VSSGLTKDGPIGPAQMPLPSALSFNFLGRSSICNELRFQMTSARWRLGDPLARCPLLPRQRRKSRPAGRSQSFHKRPSQDGFGSRLEKIWHLPLLPSGQDVFLEVEQRHFIVVQRLVARAGELPHRTAQAFGLRSVRHRPPRHLRGDRRIAKDVGQGRRDDLHGSRVPVVGAPTKGTQRVVSP